MVLSRAAWRTASIHAATVGSINGSLKSKLAAHAKHTTTRRFIYTVKGKLYLFILKTIGALNILF